jgi:TRAP-type C4-dicarboxylate transport system permease large subunit
MASSIVGWIVTYEQLPAAFTRFATETLQSPWLIILAMNLIMLATGMFIDLPAAVLLLTPMFVPLAAAVGMDTIQLGIMMIVNLSIGLYHPPIGTTLFITSSIAKVRIGGRGEGAHSLLSRRHRPAAGFAYLPWLTIR